MSQFNYHWSTAVLYVLLIVSLYPSHSFITLPEIRPQTQSHIGSVDICVNPSAMNTDDKNSARPEEVDSKLAKSLKKYMVQSHEEKLREIQQLEATKQVEIQSLKDQIRQLQIQTGTSSHLNSPLSPIKGRLTYQLHAYRTFLSHYMIKAEEEKKKAVNSAKEAVALKYEARIAALISQSSSSTTSAATRTKTPNITFTGRSARVLAAAQAGFSRWGDAEVQKISTMASSHSQANIASPVGTVNEIHMLPSQINADTAQTERNNNYYQQRNERISKAAHAGKQSRWGEMEEQRVVNKASNLNSNNQSNVRSTITNSWQ